MNLVLAYTGMDHAHTWETGHNLYRALKDLGHNVKNYGLFYQKRTPISDNIEFDKIDENDLLIVVDSGVFDETYFALANTKIQKIYWLSDIEINPEPYYDMCNRLKFSHIFSVNRRYLDKLKKYTSNVYYLPYAISPDHHRIIGDVKRDIEIGFLGSIGGTYSERTEFCNNIENYDIKVKIMNGFCGEDYARALNRFYMTLNLNVGFGNGLLNGRTFESIGCGSLLLNNDCEEIHIAFKKDEEIFTYRTSEDVVKIVNFVRNNREEAEKVRMAGIQSVLDRHTYKKRAEEILSKL